MSSSIFLLYQKDHLFWLNTKEEYHNWCDTAACFLRMKYETLLLLNKQKVGKEAMIYINCQNSYKVITDLCDVCWG